MRSPVTSTGSLQLPKSVGVGQSEQDKIHREWNTLDGVESDLAGKGFVQDSMPIYNRPQITEEMLTTADSKAYTATYAQQLSWFNYSSQILARVSAELLQVENEMEMIESKMRVDFRKRIAMGALSKMTAQEMVDEINLDPRHSELKLLGQQLKQYKLILNTDVENLERGLRVISRQVEIRKMEIDANKPNIPGRGYGGRGG